MNYSSKIYTTHSEKRCKKSFWTESTAPQQSGWELPSVTYQHRNADIPPCIIYNGRAERNRQHFEVAKIFREIDPRRGGGWVLIVMRVILICDIDWDKSGLRNLKNQNLKFPSAGTTFPSVGATFQSARTKNAIPKRQLPQARYLLDCPFQKLGSRMDAPISTPGIDFNERLPTFKKWIPTS